MNTEPQKKLTLSFSNKELEREYQEFFAVKSLLHVRVGLLLGGFIFTFYGVLDLFLFSRLTESLWMLRIMFAVVCACGFFFTYSDYYKKHTQPFLLFVYGIAMVLILVKMDKLGAEFQNYSYAGLMIVLGCIGLRYFYILCLVVMVVVYYYLSAIRLNYSSEVMLLNNFFLATGGIFSVFSSFMLENYMRNSFYKQRKLRSQRDNYKRVSQQLSKYISPQIYKSIFTGFKSAEIGTHRKQLTIMFSDIVDFTSISESKQPEELASWLNDYLNEMSQIALSYRGTLDKFIGDGMMVFFGDPSSSGEQNDALYCIIMAMAMRSKARRMNVAIRIGINSGECTVGNFGSLNRMEYTVVGKPVNIAAHLEKYAEPNDIVISEETYDRVKHFIRCEPCGLIKFKGMDHELAVYRVLEENNYTPVP